MPTLTAPCPDCADGRVEVAFRAVRMNDTSPADSLHEVACKRCDGTGRLETVACHECGERHDLGPTDDAVPHFCEPDDADSYLCVACRPWHEGLHLGPCDERHRLEAAEARCER